MTNPTTNQAAETSAPKAKPAAYDYTKQFLLDDGTCVAGDIPESALLGFRFSDSDGHVDVTLDALGIRAASGLFYKIAVWAALNVLSSTLARVPSASQSKKYEGIPYGTLARNLIAERVASFASGEFSGISDGESAVQVFDVVMSRLFNVELAEASRRIGVKKAELSKEDFTKWASAIRANPKYAQEKAKYDLERAQAKLASEAPDIVF